MTSTPQPVPPTGDASPLEFMLDGRAVRVDPLDGAAASGHGTLLEVLRDRLGVRSLKDGCSPQGQCGCCTVWVDGQPRVACVTPASRVAGRAITTVAGLDAADEWATRLCATGGSQCGFCTPGIVMRLAALAPAQRTPDRVRQGLLAHLCRCTGWQTVVEAACVDVSSATGASATGRSFDAASQRATIEGGVPQRVAPDVALGGGGFPADTAPRDAWHAVRDIDGEWHVAPTLSAARAASGKVQGRRTTEALSWPIEVPPGDWVRTLQTAWVEPGYLEPAAAWCAPGGTPTCDLANGGAFGAKSEGELAELGAVARRLADACGRPVVAAWSREDVVRLGAKRPPLAAGVRADGTGVVRVARTPGIAAAITAVAPGLVVEEVDVPGPPTTSAVRGAGWAEAAVLLAPSDGWVRSPSGGAASAEIDVGVDGRERVRVTVRCGAPLDEVVLRSYCIGAAHMALGWVRSEGITVDSSGQPLDLTVRSLGIIRSVDMPEVDVEVVADDGPAVNGSDAVFAAVALAAWRREAFAPRWPTMRA